MMPNGVRAGEVSVNVFVVNLKDCIRGGYEQRNEMMACS